MNDFTIKIWDAVDGGPVFQTSTCHTLAFNRDETRIASGSNDGTYSNCTNRLSTRNEFWSCFLSFNLF